MLLVSWRCSQTSRAKPTAYLGKSGDILAVGLTMFRETNETLRKREEAEARHLLQEAVWTDPDRMGGQPCLRGTRFPVAQVLAELASGQSVNSIAALYETNQGKMEDFLAGLALAINSGLIVIPGESDGG